MYLRTLQPSSSFEEEWVRLTGRPYTGAKDVDGPRLSGSYSFNRALSVNLGRLMLPIHWTVTDIMLALVNGYFKYDLSRLLKEQKNRLWQNISGR